MAGVYYGRRRLVGAHQELRDFFDRALRRGQPDTLCPPPGERIEPRQGEREMAAPLVPRHGMDLVHDDRPDRPQHFAGALGRQNQIERFRRGDQDVRRLLEHRLPLRLGRVTSADQRPHLDIGQPLLPQARTDLGERLREVFLDVVRERLERRDVDALNLILQYAVEPLADERINRRKERRKCLTGPGGRGDEDVVALLNDRPRPLLRLGGLLEALGEPVLNNRMEARQRHKARNIPEPGALVNRRVQYLISLELLEKLLYNRPLCADVL